MDFQELLDNLRDFLEENRKMAVIVCSGLCLLMMLMLIAICIQNSSKKKLSVHEEKKLVLDQPLLIPDGPTVPKGYITSRKTEKNWSDNQIEEWFTLPDAGEVEKLSQANDRIINEIIGAAP